MTATSDNSALIIDAINKTQPQVLTAYNVGDSLLSEIVASGAKTTLYRNYEKGEHRSGISTQMKKMLRLSEDNSGINDFNDNYCQIVVDKMAGRLEVAEITLGDDEKNKWLSQLLEKNNWKSLQGTVFRGAVRDGDSFIMIDPETLEWTSEPAYDGYSGVYALFYSNSTTPYWACKIWSEGLDDADNKNTMRLIVYQEGKVSYWRGQESGTTIEPDNTVSVASLISRGVNLTNIPSGADVQTLMINERPWVVSSIPIIHHVNKYDNYSESGESEIRPAIPLQDVLNRTLHSMVMASEFSAFNIIYSIGLEVDASGIVPGAVLNLTLKDKDGNVITSLTEEMLRFLQSVRVGQLQGSDISQYTNQIDKIVREISQATQTPIYGITNQGAVSGDALKQLEIGLIGKCERFQKQNTDAIRKLIKLSAEIQKTFAGDYGDLPSPPEIESVGVIWKSPEILDVTSQILAYVTMRRDAPGLWDDTFYHKKIGALLGLSQSDIASESSLAINSQARRLASIVGSDGTIPPV